MITPYSIPEKTKCFQIWYEPQFHLLQLQWLALSSVHHVGACLLEVVSRLQSERIESVLLELSSLPELSAMDQYWLEVNYLPTLPKLPLQRLALVLSSHTQHQLLLEAGLHHPAFDIQVFDDAATALEWLRHSATAYSAGSERATSCAA